MTSIPAQSPNLATTLFDDFSLSFWTPSDVSFKLILIFFPTFSLVEFNSCFGLVCITYILVCWMGLLL